MNYLIFTENYTSLWEDKTGVHYHFPFSKYKNLITSGSKFIYYRGSRGPKGERVIPEYFGTGLVGPISSDPSNTKAAYCQIINYQPFIRPIPFETPEGEKLEDTGDRLNHYRDGVRSISVERFNLILSQAELGQLDAHYEQKAFQIEVAELRKLSTVALKQALNAGSNQPVQRK